MKHDSMCFIIIKHILLCFIIFETHTTVISMKYTFAVNMYFTVSVCVLFFRLVSNFIDIIAIVECHN